MYILFVLKVGETKSLSVSTLFFFKIAVCLPCCYGLIVIFNRVINPLLFKLRVSQLESHLKRNGSEDNQF